MDSERLLSPTREWPDLDLRRLEWAAGLSDETFVAIRSAGEQVDFRTGQVILEVDTAITHVYFLVTGRVQATYYDLLGKEVQSETLVRGLATGLIGLGGDQSRVHAEATEPTKTIRFTVSELFHLTRQHEDFQQAIFHLLVSSFKRYSLVNRFLPKPSIVGIVHQSEASRPLTGRLTRRLRGLDESPCIAGDDERWKPQGNVPFKFFRAEEVGQNILKGWALDRRLLIDVRADQTPAAMKLLLSYADIVLWCILPQDSQAAVNVLQGLEKDVPGWRDKIRIVWVLDNNTPIAPDVPELRKLATRDFKVTLDASQANANRLLQHGVERIVHHLRGVQIGLALGGGAARGMAHLGVLKALAHHGIYVDMLAGTSAGAMTGTLYSAGLDPDFIARSFKNDLRLSWFFRHIPAGGYWYLLYKYRFHQFDPMLRKYLGRAKLEQLPLPMSVVSVDLVEGNLVVREDDDATSGILASINLPPLSLPIIEQDRALVDGGLLNNVPANVLVTKGCNFVIASTVTAKLEKDFKGIRSKQDRSIRSPIGATLQVIMRQSMIQGHSMNSVGVQPADFVFAPDVKSFDMSEFTRVDEMAHIGETTTNENVAKLRTMLRRLDSKLFESSYADAT